MRVCGSRWLILSARHGLVNPEDLLEPYDETVSDPGRLTERLLPALAEAAAPLYSTLPRRYHKALQAAAELLGLPLEHASKNPQGWTQPIGKIIQALRATP